MPTKTDFLGNEYKPGDYVIYAQSAGRSINMVKGQVVDIKDNGNVRIQPIAGSRWTSHHGSTYTVDNRTGKRIEPWKGTKHIKAESHYVHTATGTVLSNTSSIHSVCKANGWNYYKDIKYVPTVFNDYVETRTSPIKPVTIIVTENIVKYADGELSSEV